MDGINGVSFIFMRLIDPAIEYVFDCMWTPCKCMA